MYYNNYNNNYVIVNIWLCVTLDLYMRASVELIKIEYGAQGRVLYLLAMRLEASAYKSNVTHTEPYINCFVITLHMHKPP